MRVSAGLLFLSLFSLLPARAGVEEARRALLDKRPADALEALEAEGVSPELDYWRGRCLAALGRYDEAGRQLQRVPKEHALFPYAARTLIFCWHACPDADLRRAVEGLEADAPDEVSRLASAALAEYDLYRASGDPAVTEKRLERAWPEGAESSAERRLLELYRLASGGRFDEALALCRRLEAEGEQDLQLKHRARLAMAEIYYRMAENGDEDQRAMSADKAEETLLQFISSNPDSPLLEDAFRRLHERGAFEASSYARDKLVEWAQDVKNEHRCCLALFECQVLSDRMSDGPISREIVNAALSSFPNEPVTKAILREQVRRMLAGGLTSQVEPYVKALDEDDPYRLFFTASTLKDSPREAHELYCRAARSAPSELRASALVNALICALRLGDEAEAARLMDAAKESPRLAAQLLTAEALYFAPSRPAEAARLLESLLQLPLSDSQKADATMDLVELLLTTTQETERAQALLDGLEDADLTAWSPEQMLRCTLLHELSLMAQLPNDVQEVNRRSLRKTEELMRRPGARRVLTDLRLHHAALLDEAGYHAEAAKEFKRWLAVEKSLPVKARYYLSAAQAYASLGTQEARREAVFYLQRCEQIDSPWRYRAIALHVELLLLEGRVEEALNMLSQALKGGDKASRTALSPIDRALLASALADALVMKGGEDASQGALRALEEALADKDLPVNWRFRLRLHHAMICLRADMTEKAIADFESIIKARPLAQEYGLKYGGLILYVAGAGEISAWLELGNYAKAAEAADRVADMADEASGKTRRFAKRLRNWAAQIRLMYPAK